MVDTPAQAPVRRHAVVTMAFATGLCVGLVDISFSTLPAPPILNSIPYASASLAVTTCVFAALYALLWYVVLVPVARVTHLQREPLSVALAFAVVTAFGLAKVVGAPLEPNSLPRWALVFQVAAVLAVGVYFVAASAARLSPRARVLLRLSGALPAAALLTTLFVWVEIYRVGSFASAASVGAFAVYGVALLLLVAWFRRERGRRGLAAMVVGVSIPVVVGAVIHVSAVRRGSSFESDSPGTSGHPLSHVFLITVDTLRRDALSCYDPERRATPSIDALAADGIVYDRAYSASPWTLPSLSTIMTGVSPFVHGAVTTTSRLPGDFETLPERLREAGYRTAGVGRSGILSPHYNVARGFTHHDFFPKHSPGGTVGEVILRRLARGDAAGGATTAVITDRAIAWIEHNADVDAFMWIHYLDPHQPYEPPSAYLPDAQAPETMGNRFMVANVTKVPLAQVPGPPEREWIRELYDAEVRYVDDNVGRFIESLKQLGLYDDALIILTSDHGEEFWEHGGFEHGHTVYEELVSVPLVVKPPHSSFAAHCGEIVSNGSILPTVTELCGVEWPESLLSYHSIAPTWRPDSEASPDAHTVCTGVMYYQQKETIVFPTRKYIRSLATGREEVFDLDADRRERHSIDRVEPDDVARLREALDAYREREWFLRDRFGAGSESINESEESIKRLRALGYM